MIEQVIQDIHAKNAKLPRHKVGFYVVVIAASAVAVAMAVF